MPAEERETFIELASDVLMLNGLQLRWGILYQMLFSDSRLSGPDSAAAGRARLAG